MGSSALGASEGSGAPCHAVQPSARPSIDELRADVALEPLAGELQPPELRDGEAGGEAARGCLEVVEEVELANVAGLAEPDEGQVAGDVAPDGDEAERRGSTLGGGTRAAGPVVSGASFAEASARPPPRSYLRRPDCRRGVSSATATASSTGTRAGTSRRRWARVAA